MFAPVASHESIRLLLQLIASEDLKAEGCDVDNPYFFGDFDIPIRIKQPTNSSMILSKPGYDIFLIKSLYGALQAGKIWGNEVHNKLININFFQSKIDPHLYYFTHNSDFIIPCVVVDDIAFASNNPTMISQFKKNFAATFDTKFYGELNSFIRWTIIKTPDAILVNQTSNCPRLLSRFNMEIVTWYKLLYLQMPTSVPVILTNYHLTKTLITRFEQ